MMYLVHHINYKMRFDNPFYLSVDGSHNFEIPINRSLIMRGGSLGVSKVCISENGMMLDTVSVSKFPFHRWKANINIPESLDFIRVLTVAGLSENGSVVTQTERAIRVIPTNRLVLKRWRYFWDWHYEFRWEWDFTFGKYASLYTISGLEKDGWYISPSKNLEIPESCNFSCY